MPALEGLNNNYGAKGVSVVSILLDVENIARAKLVLQKTGSRFTTLQDDGTLGRKIFAVPQTYFLDSEGTVIYAVIGSRTQSQFEEIVESLLK